MGEADKLFTDGEAYERLMGRWSRIVGEAFLEWLNVPKNLRWLEVGCGNGAFTEELIARCAPAAVTAIDPSDDQLAYARARPGVRMTDFRVGDAQNLSFADRTFDVATMALVVSFLPDPGRAAAEMARVVRPGGWVAAYMWDHPGGEPQSTRFTWQWNRWVRLPCAHLTLRPQGGMPCKACGKTLGLKLSRRGSSAFQPFIPTSMTFAIRTLCP